MTAPGSLVAEGRAFVGGEWCRIGDGSTLPILDPATEELATVVADPTAADVDAAVSAARRAFDDSGWRWLSIKERAEILARVGAEIDHRWTDELAVAFTTQCGTPISISQGLRAMVQGAFADITRLADGLVLEEETQGVASTATLWHEPVGVVGAISPWNGQLYLILTKLLPALLTGCTVVAKPSPETALEATVLGEAFAAAGIPAGVVSILPGGREAGAALVAHPGIDAVTFTGSTAAGKQIMAACADRVARVSLELGGKSPAIVLDDVSLDAVIPQLLPGTILLTGQACALLSRILVPRSRQHELADALAAAIAAIPFGDPREEHNLMGPLVSRAARDHAAGIIRSAIDDGARLIIGGPPPGTRRGWYVEPTVFADVDNAMRVARDEVFGPVISVIPYDGVDDAVRIANDTPFGLAAAVFSTDEGRAWNVARRVRAGVVTLNGFSLDPGIPFGGFKQSGIGREGGFEGLLPYLETKAVHHGGRFRLEGEQ